MRAETTVMKQKETPAKPGPLSIGISLVVMLVVAASFALLLLGPSARPQITNPHVSVEIGEFDLKTTFTHYSYSTDDEQWFFIVNDTVLEDTISKEECKWLSGSYDVFATSESSDGSLALYVGDSGGYWPRPSLTVIH